MTTTDDTQPMASWSEILDGHDAGWPLAAITATTESWIRSWDLVGTSGDADHRDPEAVERLHRKLRRLRTHTPATLPEHLMEGWQVDLEIITAHGPVRMTGRLAQDLVLDWPLDTLGGRVLQSMPCRALMVTTETGLPVLVWADRILTISHYRQTPS
ncbi:hypothetical protein [Nocardiopsis sp. NPDC006938]|uniref:hypothetical protein n=1 Tax=Nocardiopsis sp. NPDC006938 TaxID=3364337 RepID=UPI0036A6A2DF